MYITGWESQHFLSEGCVWRELFIISLLYTTIFPCRSMTFFLCDLSFFFFFSFPLISVFVKNLVSLIRKWQNIATFPHTVNTLCATFFALKWHFSLLVSLGLCEFQLKCKINVIIVINHTEEGTRPMFSVVNFAKLPIIWQTLVISVCTHVVISPRLLMLEPSFIDCAWVDFGLADRAGSKG